MAPEGTGIPDLAGEAPDPVPQRYAAWLVSLAGGVGEASRILHSDPKSTKRWVDGDKAMPWAAAELLRIRLTSRY